MQNADTVLAVLRERGKRGLPLERVYRLLFNRELYLRAYGKLARNAGALTPGATPETADGMSPAKPARSGCGGRPRPSARGRCSPSGRSTAGCGEQGAGEPGALA